MKASLPFNYITSVKNGKWYVVFDYKDYNGKRKRKWVKTDLPEKSSKKALKAKTDEIVAEFEREFENQPTQTNNDVATSSGPDMLIEKYFDMWLLATKPEHARTTQQSYRMIVNGFSAYLNEHYPKLTLSKIERTIIQEYINYKLSTGVKSSTIKQLYLSIHSAFTYAVKMELLEKHPMDKMTMPRVERHEGSFYNKDELNLLFKAFENDKLELVVHIAAFYGLRRSEILGLRWDAIDFSNKTISIKRKVIQAYDDNGVEAVFVETRLKTNSTRRTLPLIPHIEKKLLSHKKMQEEYRRMFGNTYNKDYDGFICLFPDGNIIKPIYVSQHFHYVLKKHGLKLIRFHDLRHSCASLLLANDIPMKAIQEWLGHSNFSITANLYSHLEYNAKIASAETIERILGASETINTGIGDSEEPVVKKKKKTESTTGDSAST